MNYVLIEGHSVKHDLRELLRIVFKDGEYSYIDSIEEYPNKGNLFLSSLRDLSEGTFLMSKYYVDGKLVGVFEERVNDIEVHIDRDDKRINVAVKKGLLKSSKNDKLPWGILTGIRPSKIVHDLIDKNLAKEEIGKVLREEYLVSNEKADLLIDVALRQRKYISEGKDKYSLYISIPFCPTRCLYCSFPSLNLERYEDEVENYIKTLTYEIDETLKLMEGKKINTIYIGGGTPTSIRASQLEKIILKLKEAYGTTAVEWTVEAGRPDTLNNDYLEMLKNQGIDRISINPQSMNERTLEIIGRSHTVEDIKDIYRDATKLGFKAINMDLIIGLPGEERKDILNSVDEILRLNPENITIHTLAVKRASRFKKTMDEYKLESEESMKETMDIIQGKLLDMGYYPYYLYRQKNSVGNLENIGYSKDGLECIYNISMMEERETIIALGFGGVSKIYMGDGKIKRAPNFKGYHDYMERIDELINNKKKILKASR